MALAAAAAFQALNTIFIQPSLLLPFSKSRCAHFHISQVKKMLSKTHMLTTLPQSKR